MDDCRTERVNSRSEQLKTWHWQTGTLTNYFFHITKEKGHITNMLIYLADGSMVEEEMIPLCQHRAEILHIGVSLLGIGKKLSFMHCL